VGPLDAQQRGDRAVACAGLDIGSSTRQAKRRRLPVDRLTEGIYLLVHHAGEAADPPRDRQRHEAEELRTDTALPHPRQVHVPSEDRAPEGRLVPDVKVVSEPPRPHERVGVQVDGGMCDVQRSSLFGCSGVGRS
jgi:hypothetical protein